MSKSNATVSELMAKAFMPGRDARSVEYMAGVRALLALRIDGAKLPRSYEMGTVQADPFYAGVDGGHRIWHALQDEQN